MTFKSTPNAKALRPASHLIKWKPIDVFQNDGRIDLAWINVEVFVWRFSLKKVFLKISQNPQENTCAMVCFKKVAGLLWLLLSIENGLTHFISPVSFNSPWKHQKTSDFLMFSSSISSISRPVTWIGKVKHDLLLTFNFLFQVLTAARFKQQYDANSCQFCRRFPGITLANDFEYFD